MGPAFSYRLWMPPAKSPAASEEAGGIAPYPGLDALVLNFRKSGGADYALSFSHLKAGKIVADFPTGGDVEARVKTLEQMGDYKIVLIDVLAKIDGPGYVGGVLLVAPDSSAFLGSIACDEAKRTEIQQIAKVRDLVSCDEMRQIPPLSKLWHYSLHGVADMHDGLYAFYQKAVARREITFLVECSRFGNLAPKFEGFPTVCTSW